MTARESAAYIDRTGHLRCDDLSVDVLVVDARQVWDRVDVKVTPVSGTGEQWVSLERVTLSDGREPGC
tara:strand:- start:558 stop:761 length:204 start_codon:yes stop_codon:yes gene_type:complete